MSKKILISLVGGRPVPNIQFILHEKPDVIYLVSSKDSAGKGGNKEKLRNALPDKLKPLDANCIDVNPYSMQETIDACLVIFKANKENEIILQSASEPTTMSLAAYKVCLDNVEKYKNIKFFYSSRDGIVDVFKSEKPPTPIVIGLKDYFIVYGWDITMQKTNVHSNLLTLLAKDIDTSHKLLLKIRQNPPKGGIGQEMEVRFLNPKQSTLLQQMEKEKAISNLTNENGVFTFWVSSLVERFFRGDWLECYVFSIAESLKFDECAWNVLAKGGIGELDFVGISNGQLVIVSCKTERNIANNVVVDYCKELSARAEQLGKGMCTKLLVTTYSPRTVPHQDQLKKWSQEYGVMLVVGDDIPNLKQKLEEALADRSRI